MKWKDFWFESSQAWGMITSKEKWEEFKKQFDGYVDFGKAREWNNSTINYYGFAMECQGKKTLAEFFSENDMEI